MNDPCPRCHGFLYHDGGETRCIQCGHYEFPPYAPDPLRTSCYYSCGNPPAPGKVACAACAAKMREYRQRREKQEVGA